MKKNEVKIGGVYTAKVTNKVVQVRIDAREPPRRLGRHEPGHRQEGPHQERRSGCAARRGAAAKAAAAKTRRRRRRPTRRPPRSRGSGADAEPKPQARSGPRRSPRRSG